MIVIQCAEAGDVHLVPDAQGLLGTGRDPKAIVSVLNHQGRTRLVEGNGSLDSDPLGLVRYMIRIENPVDWRDGQSPRVRSRALQYLDIREREDVELDSDVVQIGR